MKSHHEANFPQVTPYKNRCIFKTNGPDFHVCPYIIVVNFHILCICIYLTDFMNRCSRGDRKSTLLPVVNS